MYNNYYSSSTGAAAYTPEQRTEIVREVLEGLIAPSDLARKYKISAHSIRDWVKKTGQPLPKQYKKSEWGIHRPESQITLGCGPVPVNAAQVKSISNNLNVMNKTLVFTILFKLKFKIYLFILTTECQNCPNFLQLLFRLVSWT